MVRWRRGIFTDFLNEYWLSQTVGLIWEPTCNQVQQIYQQS